MLYPRVTELVRAGNARIHAEPVRVAALAQTSLWVGPAARPRSPVTQTAVSDDDITAKAGVPALRRSPIGEFVYRAAVTPASLYDFLWYAWDQTQEECDAAYVAWQRTGGRDAYAIYRAAQDRADAAQDALADCHREAAIA